MGGCLKRPVRNHCSYFPLRTLKFFFKEQFSALGWISCFKIFLPVYLVICLGADDSLSLCAQRCRLASSWGSLLSTYSFFWIMKQKCVSVLMHFAGQQSYFLRSVPKSCLYPFPRSCLYSSGGEKGVTVGKLRHWPELKKAKSWGVADIDVVVQLRRNQEQFKLLQFTVTDNIFNKFISWFIHGLSFFWNCWFKVSWRSGVTL